MSFFSYKNGNSEMTPGCITGNPCQGLNERICIQVKNVYDACIQQEQLDDRVVTLTGIVPVLSDASCRPIVSRPCACECDGCSCECTCRGCGNPLTYNEAVENAGGRILQNILHTSYKTLNGNKRRYAIM